MLNSGEKIYLKRKLGFGMGIRYTLSAITPLLLVFLITTVLVFALIFIFSLSTAIDRMIVLLGSGSLALEEEISPQLLPSGSFIDEVSKGEGILYSENGESIVYLKGVEEKYFSPERREGLKLENVELEGNWIILSSTLADTLDVEIGDRMTLLLYQEDRGRTRPFLLNIAGIFDSGYVQLDRYMAYISPAVLDSQDIQYEVLLPSHFDVEDVQLTLEKNGISSSSYKSLYSSLYLNVEQSILILYIILVAVALLSAFFSIDVSQVYLLRDKNDIALLSLLGMGKRAIKDIYLKLTLISIFIATLLGSFVGIILGMFSPFFVELVSRLEPAMLEYYITSFNVSIPWIRIFLMEVMMLGFAYISLHISLSHWQREDIYLLVNNV